MKILDKNLNNFKRKERYLLSLVLLAFIFSILFKLHGLSINQWDKYLPSQNKIDNILIGKAQGIRSDEWLVSTPYIMSQIKNNFSIKNENIGVKNTPVIVHYNLPTYHFSAFFKPQNFGFFLFDFERGFSFAWNYKVFGLIISTFFLLKIVTQNNFLLSITGSLMTYLASFNQWWFSIPLPDLIIAFNMIVVFYYYFIFAKSLFKIILYALGIVYFFINFALILYPPFQVTLGYLALFLMVAISIEYYKKGEYNYNLLKTGATFLAIVFIAGFLYYYYVDTKGVIDIILNTDYPGQRKLSGGGEDISHYFSGYYDFLYSASKFPAIYGNVCESSNFFLIFPLFIPFLIVVVLKKHMKIDFKIWFLLIYITFISIWIFIGFGENIAHYTLFEKVPPNRALLGLGIANILLSIVLINWYQKSEYKSDYNSEIYIIVFFSLFFLGKIMQVSDGFYTNTKIIVSSFIFTLIFWSIFTKKIKTLAFLLIGVSLPGFFVNPLAYGMPQFRDKELAKFISQSKFEKKLWLAYDNVAIPMYLKALGLDVLNGVNFIPNFARLNILDTEKKNMHVYNRYAHIVAKPLFKDSNVAKFKLIQPDLYEVYINPCDEKIKLLGVKYFIFPAVYEEKIDKLEGCKLVKLTTTPLNNYNIYERFYEEDNNEK